MAELRVGFGAELLAPKRRFMFAGWEVLVGRRGGVASSLREMLTRECGVAWSRCLSYVWRIGVALKGSGCPSRRPGYDFTFLGRRMSLVSATCVYVDVRYMSSGCRIEMLRSTDSMPGTALILRPPLTNSASRGSSIWREGCQMHTDVASRGHLF